MYLLLMSLFNIRICSSLCKGADYNFFFTASNLNTNFHLVFQIPLLSPPWFLFLSFFLVVVTLQMEDEFCKKNNKPSQQFFFINKGVFIAIIFYFLQIRVSFMKIFIIFFYNDFFFKFFFD